MNTYVNKGNPHEKAVFDTNVEQFEATDASGIKKTWWLETAYQKFNDDAAHLSRFIQQTENNPQIPVMLNKDEDGKVLVPIQGTPVPLVPAPKGVKTDETGVVVSQSGNVEKVDKDASSNIPDAKVGYSPDGKVNSSDGTGIAGAPVSQPIDPKTGKIIDTVVPPSK